MLSHYLNIKLQVLSFMFTPNCRRCLFFSKVSGGVLNLPKSYVLCHLGQTQLDFLVKSDHVLCTLGYSCHFTFLKTIF
ncbi:hypothetical protein Hanom_Chr00s048268g01778351 [Helianthus anomalus]